MFKSTYWLIILYSLTWALERYFVIVLTPKTPCTPDGRINSLACCSYLIIIYTLCECHHALLCCQPACRWTFKGGCAWQNTEKFAQQHLYFICYSLDKHAQDCRTRGSGWLVTGKTGPANYLCCNRAKKMNQRKVQNLFRCWGVTACYIFVISNQWHN